MINKLSRKGADVLTAAAADSLLVVSSLSQKEVERLVEGAYRRQGYQVSQIGAAAQSESAMLLTKASQRVLLQCKYWKTRKLAEMPVRELYGMMAAQSANGGILITSGTFTLEASRFAGYGHIQLIDGPRLLLLLRQSEAPQAPGAQLQRASAAAR